MAEHLESGHLAEHAAKRYLEDQGLRWLTSNYRCRYGELDLIMSDEEHLVIIEIRYRRHSKFMQPMESITRVKCTRIAKATLHFMQHSAEYRNFPVRFDVLSISGPLQRPVMNWITGAFTAEDLRVG